jgi:putative transposase
MPRRARLRIAGVPLHLVQRGNNRAPCFFKEADYALYLGHLSELAVKFACAVHAYVLMTNHVHLLMTPACEDGPSLLMKHLGQRYVQHVNRAYGRTGTMWEGRFRSSIVQQRTYFLRCHRYIELNPVRAGIVSRPSDYRWSSYQANSGRVLSSLVTPHAEYLALGETDEERTAAYRALFGADLDSADLSEIRSAVNGGFAFGSAHFKNEVAEKLGRRVERGKPGRPKRTPAREDLRLPLLPRG